MGVRCKKLRKCSDYFTTNRNFICALRYDLNIIKRENQKQIYKISM